LLARQVFYRSPTLTTEHSFRALAPGKGEAVKQLTYTRQRGYHYWVCLVCGKQGKEGIPDQADCRYEHNPGNPWLGVCGSCNGGSPSAGIRLGNSSIPVSRNGFDGEREQSPKLDGDWGEYWQIARRFERKAPFQDREDLRHSIILRLSDVARAKQAKEEAFTEAGKLRTASYTVLAYWRDAKRNGKVISLNTEIEGGDGDTAELWETIADDRAIDLEAWVDARVWLRGCPRRLVAIARKRANGIALELADRKYLCKWRKREQKRLL